MAYVPPHLRNRKPQTESKTVQPTQVEKKKQPVFDESEKSFPVLGGSATQRSSWIGRKFAELATEWNEDDERRKEDAELTKISRHDYTVVLPRFKNIRKFEEPEDQQVEVSPSAQIKDDWTTIERKKQQQKPNDRREKTFEEYEKEADKQQKDEETVWDVPEHETCWDERY